MMRYFAERMCHTNADRTPMTRAVCALLGKRFSESLVFQARRRACTQIQESHPDMVAVFGADDEVEFFQGFAGSGELCSSRQISYLGVLMTPLLACFFSCSPIANDFLDVITHLFGIEPLVVINTTSAR
jgi:hypothetical protein